MGRASNGSNGAGSSNGHTGADTGMGASAEASGSCSSGNGTASTSSSLAELISLVASAERGSSSRHMYPDDDDWAEHQQSADGDITMEGDTSLGLGEGVLAAGYGKRMPVDKEEFVRLMLQGLRDVGYEQAASVLEAESGVTLASQPVIDLQAALLGGRWSESLSLLQQLGIIPSPDPDAAEPESSASSIRSGKARSTSSSPTADAIRFLISRQKYLEMLEVGQSKKALAVLRSELASVVRDPDVLHTLSGFMMCIDTEDLFERAQWDGAAGTSRRRLLESLQEYIPPSIMVPSRRLATLFDQARAYQRQSCLYHTDPEPFSLYVNHECKAGAFPTETTHILADHKGQVWTLAWSPDGGLLASADADGLVVIWKMTVAGTGGEEIGYKFEPLHHLRDHGAGVGVVAFSPDGGVLVCAADRQLSFWDMETGLAKKMKHTVEPHNDEISAIRWLPDGSSLIVSSLDNKILFYSPEGEILRKLDTAGIQVKDIALTPDTSRLVLSATLLKRGSTSTTGSVNRPKPAMSGRTIHDPANGLSSDPIAEFGYEGMNHCIVVVKRDTLEVVWVFDEIKAEISSLEISADGKRVLVSTVGEGIYLLSLEPSVRIIRRFEGHLQTKFLIRSAFGAGRDRFILTGSEDSKVYVYQTSQPRPIEVLSGHDGPVSAVAWNPVSGRQLFASCSDDNDVRIWQPPGRAE